MMQRVLVFTAAALLMASAYPAIAQSDEEASAKVSAKISILDTTPLYYQIKRYPKYYGDANMDRSTIDGSIFKRQYLLGSLGGFRDKLAEHGLIIDLGVTQTVQGVVSGDGDHSEYFGSSDLWIALDTGRANLWPGGLFYAHVEGDWGQTVSGSGALLPLNGDTIMPAAPSTFALSELFLLQGLPAGFALIVGKVNWSDFADKSPFANDERNQFLHEGLTNNVLLGGFVPYTSLGFGILKQFTEDFGAAMVITSNNTNALSGGFDKLSLDTMTYGLAATWTPKFGGKPGVYDMLVGYTAKSSAAFDIDKRYFADEIFGRVSLAEKDDNYALTLGGTQYLWVDKSAKRSDGQPVGFGPFMRFGIAPKDRNLIDQFFSLGIGGIGGPFGRVNDNWGIGWSGTHLSKDFRRNVESLSLGGNHRFRYWLNAARHDNWLEEYVKWAAYRDIGDLNIRVDSFEHGVEAYYNFALTPAIRLSLHAQYINSAISSKDDAFILGTRLQLDF